MPRVQCTSNFNVPPFWIYALYLFHFDDCPESYYDKLITEGSQSSNATLCRKYLIYIYPHFLSIFLFDLFSTEHGCNVKTKCVLETNTRQFWQPLKKWLEGLYYHFTSQTVLFKWLHVTWTSLNICNFLLTIPEFEIEKFKCFRTS